MIARDSTVAFDDDLTGRSGLDVLSLCEQANEQGERPNEQGLER